MKVLLISDNRCRENLVPYPIGIACVAAATAKAGHEVRGLDLMFSEDPTQDVVAAIGGFQPDCIGLSIRNIDNQDMRQGKFYLPVLKELVQTIKSTSPAPIILGGAGFTIFPLECLEYFGLAMGITGEGEAAFVELLDCLGSGAAPSGIPGLAIKRDGLAKVNPNGPYLDIDGLPPPDRAMFDVRPYDGVPRGGPPFVANVQSRRGCHLRCLYCPNPMVEGRIIRLREPRLVADELQSLEEHYGVKTAFFTDSLFNYPPEYTIRLLREIISRKLSLRWICSYNPIYNDPVIIRLMRQAGCYLVSIGNESGSAAMLETLRKDFSTEDVRRAVTMARAEGLQVNCFLLLGGPGETRRSVEESVEMMARLAPEAVRVTVGIRLYPGCRITEIAREEGVISPGQNLLYPAFYLARKVEPWLHDHMRHVCSKHKGWFM